MNGTNTYGTNTYGGEVSVAKPLTARLEDALCRIGEAAMRVTKAADMTCGEVPEAVGNKPILVGGGGMAGNVEDAIYRLNAEADRIDSDAMRIINRLS